MFAYCEIANTRSNLSISNTLQHLFKSELIRDFNISSEFFVEKKSL